MTTTARNPGAARRCWSLYAGDLQSVATVSLTTAVVTASFVFQQRRLSGEAEPHQELRDALARIEQRLEPLERRAP